MHHTDDDEFFIPRDCQICSEQEPLHEALGCIYNSNVREHSSLEYLTPFQYLKQQLPESDDHICIVIPIMPDRVAAAMGHWVDTMSCHSTHMWHCWKSLVAEPRAQQSASLDVPAK